MSLQTRIVFGMLGVAALAVATRSVLVLGYAFAALMFVMIMAVMIRHLVQHHSSHRDRQPSGLSLVFRRGSRERDGRRAAA